MRIKFETWKTEYVPRIYVDSGAECYEHDVCECEFLYTVDLDELDEEDINAVAENRIWTWQIGGAIVSGVQSPGWDFLITEKPYTGDITVN